MWAHWRGGDPPGAGRGDCPACRHSKFGKLEVPSLVASWSLRIESCHCPLPLGLSLPCGGVEDLDASFLLAFSAWRRSIASLASTPGTGD